VIGSYFLPKENQLYLSLFKTWVLPIIEISILVFIVIKARRTIQTYKGLTNKTSDFYSAVKTVCSDIMPRKVVVPVATEVAVIFYGFINWKKRILKHNEFSYHHKSGSPALLGVLILIIAVETVAIHLLLERWNVVVAWVLSGLSIYTAIQLFGLARSLSQRPIAITLDSLLLRYGFLNESEIPLTDIDIVELSRKSLDKDKLTVKLSPLGELESHNVIIHLNKENELRGMYGIRKTFRKIGLYVDKPTEFKERLDGALE